MDNSNLQGQIKTRQILSEINLHDISNTITNVIHITGGGGGGGGQEKLYGPHRPIL